MPLERNVAYITSTSALRRDAAHRFQLVPSQEARDGEDKLDYETVVLSSPRVLTGVDPDDGYENPLLMVSTSKGCSHQEFQYPAEDPDEGYENPLSQFSHIL